jgi:hypothetical protein
MLLAPQGLTQPAANKQVEAAEEPSIPIPLGHVARRCDNELEHYCMLAKGWYLSRIITKGMTMAQVTEILGPSDGFVGGLGGFTFEYASLGVAVNFPLPLTAWEELRVGTVFWSFRWFTR